MPRRINEIQLVGFTIASGVVERNALRLNSNTALTLDVHRIEDLSFHLTFRKPPADLNKAVSNGGFTMVNVRNDGEISNMA